MKYLETSLIPSTLEKTELLIDFVDVWMIMFHKC